MGQISKLSLLIRAKNFLIFFKNLLTNGSKCAILLSERGRATPKREREEREMTKYENREIEEMVPEWYEDLEAVMQEMADQEEAK